MKILLTCLAVGLPFAGQAAVPTAAVVLPLERQNYFIGEKIPLATSNAGDKVELNLVDARGAVVPLYAGKAQPVVWDTTLVAAGTYQLQLNGSNTPTITLRSPIRESAMALVDESQAKQKILDGETAGGYATPSAVVRLRRDRSDCVADYEHCQVNSRSRERQRADSPTCPLAGARGYTGFTLFSDSVRGKILTANTRVLPTASNRTRPLVRNCVPAKPTP